MTVGELIQQLGAYPPDLEVVVCDSEYGTMDVSYLERRLRRWIDGLPVVEVVGL